MSVKNRNTLFSDSPVIKSRVRREKCDNCGRFTDMAKQWYSDELGHGVCNRCAEPVQSVSLADSIGYDPELEY